MTSPTQPNKIAERIRRYERLLRKDIATIGGIDDGAGKRYLLGALYLAMGDTQGALKSYGWLRKVLPDDSGEPFDYLCWTLALLRSGDLEAASKKLVQTMLRNIYLLPVLLGLEPARMSYRHGSNWEELEYAAMGPVEVFALWDEESRAWARQTYESAEVQRVREQHVRICTQLSDEPVGPKRNQLVSELFAMRRD